MDAEKLGPLGRVDSGRFSDARGKARTSPWTNGDWFEVEVLGEERELEQQHHTPDPT